MPVPRPSALSSLLALVAVYPTYALLAMLRRFSGYRIPDVHSGFHPTTMALQQTASMYTSPILQQSNALAAAAAAAVASGTNPASGCFQYIVAPSFKAKDRESLRSTGKGSKSRRPASGEDAYFYSKIATTDGGPGGVALGVVDGVGGWNDIGVDATDFSHSLTETMQDLSVKMKDGGISSKFSFPPLVLLDAAYNAIKSSGQVKAGGSTACVGVAHANGTLQAANLGDSGFYIFRQGKIQYMSLPQTHYFNAPYQLAIIPQKILDRNAKFGGKNFDDKPSDANLSTHRLQHGDVVMFCTDGVLDNLSATSCLQIVNEEMISTGNWLLDRRSGDIQPSGDRPYAGVDNVAKRLVAAAFKASNDPKNDSPFAIEAQRQMKVLYRGGKPDDITVLVMFVQQLVGKTQERL
ncbi:phosphatase 2C-like domain-containing protein [Lipomyces arxii]|uniref:phosphatase 2C-like domain-containing protein n=1 Tax=Lipomyces arxii TaxID=56418 RepID=UPI0034CE5B0D